MFHYHCLLQKIYMKDDYVTDFNFRLLQLGKSIHPQYTSKMIYINFKTFYNTNYSTFLQFFDYSQILWPFFI